MLRNARRAMLLVAASAALMSGAFRADAAEYKARDEVLVVANTVRAKSWLLSFRNANAEFR